MAKDSESFPVINHSGLDMVNQDTVNTQTIEYYVKLASLLSPPIILSDTMLLDHRPLQNWVMGAQGDLLEFLVPKDDSVLPAIVVSAREPKGFEELVGKILSDRMLFSSQSQEFDAWITNPNNNPTLDEFVKRDGRGEKWWREYLERIDRLFGLHSSIRYKWPFGNFNYPERLRQLLNDNNRDLVIEDSKAWEYFKDILDPQKEWPSRSKMLRWLRQNGHGVNSLYTALVNTGYRSILAESMPGGGWIVDNSERDAWPQKPISKTVWETANDFANSSAIDLGESAAIDLAKIPWSALLKIRSHDDFKEKLLVLTSLKDKIAVNDKDISVSISGLFTTAIKIIKASPESREYINLNAPPASVRLYKLSIKLGVTAAFTAAALLTVGGIGFVGTAVGGWAAVVRDFISIRADDPGIRISKSFGHIQREVIKNIAK